MQAAVCVEVNQPLVIEEVKVDNLRSHEVLMRVAASGLCHSDLHMITGHLPQPLPAVFGHEAAGIVEAVGSEVTSLRPGDHIVCCLSVFCGHCDPCLSGHSNRCVDRPDRAAGEQSPLMLASGQPLIQQGPVIGGFAEQMLLHEHAFVKVPRALPLDRAALLGCGVMTGFGSVFNAAQVHAGSSVVVIGCGGVGLNIVQAARISGASRIVAVDLMPAKLDLARKLGATDVVQSGVDMVEVVRELTAGGVDYAFESVGLTDTIEKGVRMLRQGGLMTIVGVTRFDATVAISPLMMLGNEWRIQGSRMGSGPFTRDIPRYASLYLAGLLDLDSLVAERIGLADINRGFEIMAGGNQARSVIVFDDVLRHAAAHA